MRTKNHFSWLIRPKSFVGLLGAEYELMKKAGGSVLLKFYTSSLLIFFIAILTFLSIRYAIELLFHVMVIEIGLSLFLSLLFVLMYIFLINTFSKQNIANSVFNFSNLSRIGFVCFMGFIISKPIEIFVYKLQLEMDVESYKQRLVGEHNKKVETLYNGDLHKLHEKRDTYAMINAGSIYQNEIHALDLQIGKLELKKLELLSSSKEKIDSGTFFIYRIQRVSGKYFLSWLICLVIILLFILPGYLIYSISRDDDYFTMKKNLEKRMVETSYRAFCEKYSSIFQNKYGLSIEVYTKYEDPPFNTILKKIPPHKNSTDFHNKYGIS